MALFEKPDIVEESDETPEETVDGREESTEVKEKKPQKKRSSPVPVRLVKTENEAALVEWTGKDGAQRRVTVPRTAVTGAAKQRLVEKDDLSMGIPYGIPVAQIIKMAATPEGVESELHKRGLWTAEDIIGNIQSVYGALQAVYGVDAATLVNAARAYLNKRR